MLGDFHSKPYDHGTQTKLIIFEEYLKEWLPVFISKRNPIWKQINIYDFFAGPGLDLNNIKGTPLLILKHLQTFRESILSKGLNVNVFLNDKQKKKIEALKRNIDKEDLHLDFLNIEYSVKDFSDAFNTQYERINSPITANLVLLDQSGIKQITEEIFKKLIKTKNTDFIFFISSSFFKRFNESFIKHLNINPEEIVNEKYYNIHLFIFNYYKKLLSEEYKYYLAPFSIKKGSNIYGLIFGTNHTLGIEKFLKICWKLDGVRGSANFDIDTENINLLQPSLFEEFNKPQKRVIFENQLKRKIFKNEFIYDFEVYEYALENGFLLKDVKNILNDLVKEKRINNNVSLISSNLHRISKTRL